MKKNKLEAFKFLFKLIILFQLYSHLKPITEATQLSQTTKENVAQFYPTDGNNLNDRMTQIEAKSQRQENEISLLKTTVVEDKRIIRKLRERVSILESVMLTIRNAETSEEPLSRQKRPYRLLPVHPAGDKMEKETVVVDTRFYGPASNCNELGRLGYTLNGYYLVKGKDESINNSVEAVLCRFRLPEESKGSTKEERLGLITIGKKVEKTHVKTTETNRIGFMSSIGTTTTSKPPGRGISSGIHSSRRRANLINGLGKCVNAGDYPGYYGSGIYLHQWDCDASVDTMLWSWNEDSLGSKNRHICNSRGLCVCSAANVAWSAHLNVFYNRDEQGQRFNFVDSVVHPGYYVIKNDHGKCLSVKGNTNKIGAQIWADDCNALEAGQRWKWHN